MVSIILHQGLLTGGGERERWGGGGRLLSMLISDSHITVIMRVVLHTHNKHQAHSLKGALFYFFDYFLYILYLCDFMTGNELYLSISPHRCCLENRL